MELRTLTPEDDPSLSWLMAEAFSRGSRPEPKERKERSPALGIFDGPRLVAAAIIHDLHLTWGQTNVPMGGLAGVACAAEQRGRGHVARLLAESLRTMREAGQYTSGLFPFAYAFYRQYGLGVGGGEASLQYAGGGSAVLAGGEICPLLRWPGGAGRCPARL